MNLTKDVVLLIQILMVVIEWYAIKMMEIMNIAKVHHHAVEVVLMKICLLT